MKHAPTAQPSAFFVRLDSRPVPRITRMMRVAEEMGMSVAFIGAPRQSGLSVRGQWEGFSVRRVGPVQPMLNGSGFFRYIAGTLRFNLAVFGLLRKEAPSLIHVSDIESSLACVAYARLSRISLVYNIHDNFADRYKVPGVLRHILNLLEGLVVLSSSETIVPEPFRRSSLPRWSQHRISVIRNTPIDQGVIAPPKSSERVRVLYAGWLDEGRGLGALLRMAEREPALEICIAGQGDSDIRDKVISGSATWLGYLDHGQIMSEVARSHFVAALYDPVRPINRVAAPNKLAEALCVGRPVLVNSEVLVAQTDSFRSCTLRMPYADAADAADTLVCLVRDDRDKYERMCAEARRLYDQSYSWRIVKLNIEALFERVTTG